MTKPTRIIIANAQAGSYEQNSRNLSACLSDPKLPYDYVIVEIGRENMEEIVARLMRERDVDAVVAMGGDGTVCSSLSMILKHDWPVKLGVIPAGTGNLLAAALGLPLNCEEALDILHSGHVTWANVGKLNLGRGSAHYFTLNAGAGVDAEVIAGTPTEEKKAFGLLAYCMELCRRIFCIGYKRFKITVDGKTHSVAGSGVMVISHRNFLKKFYPMFDSANEADNGAFDICVFQTRTPADYMHALGELITKKYTDPDYESPVIRHYEGRCVSVQSWPKTPVQADGELVGETPARFEYIPRAVQVIVP